MTKTGLSAKQLSHTPQPADWLAHASPSLQAQPQAYCHRDRWLQGILLTACCHTIATVRQQLIRQHELTRRASSLNSRGELHLQAGAVLHFLGNGGAVHDLSDNGEAIWILKPARHADSWPRAVVASKVQTCQGKLLL